MKPNRQSKVGLPLNAALKHDLVFFNNPILIQGLALTPAIAATTTLKNALILSVALLVLVAPTRVLAETLLRFAKLPRMRAVVYALIAAVIYIPAYRLVQIAFGYDAAGPGIYLPMLAIDGLVISRFEIPARETPLLALKNGLLTTFGASLVLILLGAARELLAVGTLCGVQILAGAAPLPVAGTIAGGFIAAALFAALFQWFAGIYKREHFIMEAEAHD
ncbi:MAG: Rnf-Nqr domain containing protein [Oscillospiraceae bacterium]|nr:Rnf-Nqr domain containing protein [Oscillospiraceae bacterium]